MVTIITSESDSVEDFLNGCKSKFDCDLLSVFCRNGLNLRNCETYIKYRRIYIMSLKPIYMDAHLELHEQLVKNVGRNLTHTKKRLHEAELVH